MKVVNCLQIGFVNPTIVECEGKQLETQGLDIESLISRWKDEFHLWSEPFILTFNERDFNSIQKRALYATKSVLELFEEQDVYCICREDVLK